LTNQAAHPSFWMQKLNETGRNIPNLAQYGIFIPTWNLKEGQMGQIEAHKFNQLQLGGDKSSSSSSNSIESSYSSSAEESPVSVKSKLLLSIPKWDTRHSLHLPNKEDLCQAGYATAATVNLQFKGSDTNLMASMSKGETKWSQKGQATPQNTIH
jgi:hypothetical protein